jgi:hypothetical protein
VALVEAHVRGGGAEQVAPRAADGAGAR